jgi:sulfofructose kinase
MIIFCILSPACYPVAEIRKHQDRTTSLNSNPPIFGLGQCSLDYIGTIPTYPPPNVKCEFSNLHIECGGPVATALAALSRWGLPCCFAGVVGDDPFGKIIMDSLHKEGIDTGGVVRRIGHASQFAFIAAEPVMARRTIFWQRPTGLPLQIDELDMERLRTSRLLYTDGLFTEASIHACTKAREAGIPVIVDAGTLRDGMLEIAGMSDCFIASEIFSKAMAEDPVGTCYRLSGLGCPFVGVTLGSRGYIALADGRLIRKPAYPAKAVDTTGCGDVFHAGVAYGILQGWEPEKCLDLGAWAAASVSTQMGGRKGIPAYEDLKKRRLSDSP